MFFAVGNSFMAGLTVEAGVTPGGAEMFAAEMFAVPTSTGEH